MKNKPWSIDFSMQMEFKHKWKSSKTFFEKWTTFYFIFNHLNAKTYMWLIVSASADGLEWKLVAFFFVAGTYILVTQFEINKPLKQHVCD